MLTFVLTLVTLASTPALCGIEGAEKSLCSPLLRRALGKQSCCCPCPENHINEALLVWCLKIGKVSSKYGHYVINVYQMNFTSGKRCPRRQGGSDSEARISSLQIVLLCHIRGKGRTEVCYFPRTQIRTRRSGRRVSTQCLFHVASIVRTASMLRRMTNIGFNVRSGCVSCLRILMRPPRFKTLGSLCRRCSAKLCRLFNQKKTRAKNAVFTQEIFPKKRLRLRRHIGSGNISTSSRYSTYLSHHATGLQPSLPVTSTHTIALDNHRRPMPTVQCPEYVVINSSTIYLTKSTEKKQFGSTLVPKSKLTILLPFSQPVPSNISSAISMSSFGDQVRVTPSLTNHSQLRATTQNTTFIYNSRLVSIVNNATNSNYVFITTWDCATVTMGMPSWSTLVHMTTTSPPSSTIDSDKRAKMVLTLAVAGGAVVTFIIIVVLILLIRRYRRIQSLRKKAKQINYFNRYDRSSAWDDEPFGGSCLSVFTLKNSKFDIDWESNDGRRKDSKNDDFEGR